MSITVARTLAGAVLAAFVGQSTSVTSRDHALTRPPRTPIARHRGCVASKRVRESRVIVRDWRGRPVKVERRERIYVLHATKGWRCRFNTGWRAA